MATNHTENYGLNLWEPGDSFLREEFNENTEKIEEAISGCFSPDKLPWVTGTYTQPKTEDVQVTLGFRPTTVIFTSNALFFGIMMENVTLSVGATRNGAAISGFGSCFFEDGFTLPSGVAYFNDEEGRVVTYIAFR